MEAACACVDTQQQQHIGSAIIERRQTEREARRERSDDIAREKTDGDGQSEITREKCPSRRLRSSAFKARAR